jgi:hypothetical protein
VRGLLGAHSGQRNDLQLADGTVLPIPRDDSELLGAFADAWRVSPDASLLGDTPMQFIHPIALSGELLASAPGQVLGGAPDVNTLSDADGFGVTFKDVLTNLERELISGFSVRDAIDVTGLDGARATASYTGSDSAGVLHLSDGVRSGDIRLAGTISGVFRIAPDTNGGALITLS